MTAQFKVKNKELVKAGLRSFDKESKKVVAQQINLTVSRVTKTAKKNSKERYITPATKRTGEHVLKMIPKFARPGSDELKGQARSLAPYARHVERGTGRRGKSSFKGNVNAVNYGSKPGMDASNAFHDATEEHIEDHRNRIAEAINKVNPS